MVGRPVKIIQLATARLSSQESKHWAGEDGFLPWEQRRESGRTASCVSWPFLPTILGPCDHGDNLSGKLGDCLEEFGRFFTFAFWEHTKGPQRETLETHHHENILACSVTDICSLMTRLRDS